MTTCENALADHFKNCWCSELSDGTSYSNGRSSLPTTMTIVTIWICFCFQCLARRQWIMRSLLRICARTSVRSRSFWNQNPVLMSNGIHRPPQKIRNDLSMSLSLFLLPKDLQSHRACRHTSVLRDEIFYPVIHSRPMIVVTSRLRPQLG